MLTKQSKLPECLCKLMQFHDLLGYNIPTPSLCLSIYLSFSIATYIFRTFYCENNFIHKHNGL